MTNKRFRLFVLSLFLMLALFLILGPTHLPASGPSQTEETESRVAELSDFHEIIYPIWHTAYPEKDYAALREYVTEVNRLAKNLFEAKLPGILRDKKAKWDEGMAQMKKAVEDYNKAASAEDDRALLDAAEALHAKFEMMVRIIRPVLKEMDDFHKVLYVVYHKHLPDKKFDAIASLCGELVQKAEAITKATLPQGLVGEREAFSAAAKDLWEASQQLQEKCDAGNTEAIEKAVEYLHTQYQDLEKIFE